MKRFAFFFLGQLPKTIASIRFSLRLEALSAMKIYFSGFSVVALGLLIFSACGMAAVQENPLTASLIEVAAENIPAGTPIKDGSFSTKYDEKQKNRTTNLVIATKTLDGTIVKPGEVFSFNEIIGKATWSKGYRPAKIFVRGREEQGMGGGICQLSSTLYNAADFAGMKIVERHPHSKEVTYVKEGRDAATAYGGVDLKFRNILPHAVRIVAKAEGGEVKVALEAVM